MNLKDKLSKEEDRGEFTLLDEEKFEIKPITSPEKRFKEALADFYLHLGHNHGVIYYIGSYFVKDLDENLKRKERKELLAVESIRGFTKEEVLVLEIDARSKKGCITINKSIDIPLDNEANKPRQYFFDEADAIKEWRRLSDIELAVAKKIRETGSDAEEYLKKVIERDQH
jgi:hypothetical protein